MALLDKLSDQLDQKVENLKASILNKRNRHTNDMHKSNKMDYQVIDNTFRDIYERGNESTGDPTLFVTLTPLLGVLFVQLVALFFIPTLIRIITKLSYIEVVLRLYITAHGAIFRSVMALALSFLVYKVLQIFMRKYWDSQHMDETVDLLKQYPDDSRLVQPEELPEKYDLFPDMGAHSRNIKVTAILGHIHFNNHGLNPLEITLRADGQTDLDEDGQVINKNVAFYDDDGEVMTINAPMMDEDFGEKLWDSSSIPRPVGKNASYIRNVLRKKYSPNELIYNQQKRYDKPQYEYVSDLLNHDWYMPNYEVQRPAGAYVVDTTASNTMLLAMTRAGKGQTIVEPTIDCWLRSDEQANIVCNDSKGELYLKFYYTARKRGYQVAAFNLMDASRTDIYNPLGYAVDAARQGNVQKVEEYVQTIGDVFFPADKATEPMWPHAANSAFQRSAFGLIDYFMEEDKEIQQKALDEQWSNSKLVRELDASWGHVTLYNVYQFMTRLASKKSDDTNIIHLDDDDPSTQKDFLTLFFDATAKLPRNALRTLTQTADDSIRSMADSEKTMASILGISLTEIKFFATENISRLTSGRPSQNFDIIGMSFPRRFELKLDSIFIREHSLRGQGYTWKVYSDPKFEHELGEQFRFTNNIDSLGWLSYVTKGIFPANVVYLELTVYEQQTKLELNTWYFQFTKDYQKTVDQRSFVTDSVTHKRVIKDGVLVEIQPLFENEQASGDEVQVKPTLLPRKRVRLVKSRGLIDGEAGTIENYSALLFEQILVHYVEEPKAVFLVTPPQLASNARIILILINQMFNMQVAKSYLMLSSQKPFYDTNYMLDEIGNLKTDGSGIPGLEVKASIGQAQGQRFTFILQTLQQLKDVYGDSIDKILEGNTGNILYIRSTDTSMLEVLEGLSGKMHRLEDDNLSTTQDMLNIIGKTESKMTQNKAPKEVPVISQNDMLNIPIANLMVFGRGKPIWNRNQLAMPASRVSLDTGKLNDFEDPQHYTLRTVPTTANNMDFDILQNQPNFWHMVEKRTEQARLADEKLTAYRRFNTADGSVMTDDELSRIDPEFLSTEIMFAINAQIQFNQQIDESQRSKTDFSDIKGELDYEKYATQNTELLQAEHKADMKKTVFTDKRYANNQISREDLKNNYDWLKQALETAYVTLQNDFKKNSSDLLHVNSTGDLFVNGELAIKSNATVNAETHQVMDDFGEDTEPDLDAANGMESLAATMTIPKAQEMAGEVQPAWCEYLARLENWSNILDGKYEQAVVNALVDAGDYEE